MCMWALQVVDAAAEAGAAAEKDEPEGEEPELAKVNVQAEANYVVQVSKDYYFVCHTRQC